MRTSWMRMKLTLWSFCIKRLLMLNKNKICWITILLVQPQEECYLFLLQVPPIWQKQEQNDNLCFKAARLSGSEYVDTCFTFGSAAEVERLWSIAKHVLTDHWKSMTPLLIEAILCLRTNERFWGAGTVALATIPRTCILNTRIKPLVLRARRIYCRRMPLFNNTAMAASFKATCTLAAHNTTNGNDTKKNRNGAETKKCKLVKQEVPTGVTVLRLVLPTTEDSYYTDMPDAQLLKHSR
jgi:hypothetical protein